MRQWRMNHPAGSANTRLVMDLGGLNLPSRRRPRSWLQLGCGRLWQPGVGRCCRFNRMRRSPWLQSDNIGRRIAAGSGHRLNRCWSGGRAMLWCLDRRSWAAGPGFIRHLFFRQIDRGWDPFGQFLRLSRGFLRRNGLLDHRLCRYNLRFRDRCALHPNFHRRSCWGWVRGNLPLMPLFGRPLHEPGTPHGLRFGSFGRCGVGRRRLFVDRGLGLSSFER